MSERRSGSDERDAISGVERGTAEESPMSRTNEPALTEEIDDAPDIDATVDGDAIERADVEGEDSDIDEGALSDVPEALSVMIDDDLEEMNLGQPADPFDRI